MQATKEQLQEAKDYVEEQLSEFTGVDLSSPVEVAKLSRRVNTVVSVLKSSFNMNVVADLKNNRKMIFKGIDQHLNFHYDIR